MKENMQPDVASKTIVVGLGNTIRSDDGAGVHALKRLQLHSRVPDGVVLIDGGTQGIELLTYVCDSARLLFLDTVDVGEEPEMLVHLSGDELNRLPCGASVHQLGLRTCWPLYLWSRTIPERSFSWAFNQLVRIGERSCPLPYKQLSTR